MTVLDADFVIIGTGLAGSVAAYLLSTQGNVLLLSKGLPSESNSFAAQGGIAAAIGSDDDSMLHTKDTLIAGSELCDPEVVAYLTETAPKLVHWLRDIGVPFDKNSLGELSLGLEGAHSRCRILHAGGDATGRKVMETVTAALENNPMIERKENVHVLSLIKNPNKQVIGALGQLCEEPAEKVEFYARRAVILATGGAGQLFQRTTNPSGATGDGIALSYHAGASLRDLEFVQFHPTTLDLEGYPSFLISEAVRGAGGTLVDELGEAIMKDYPRGDLEPRDIVARAIYSSLQQGKRVYLDCRQIQDFETKFPTIFEQCRSYGLNPSQNLIPISPAAHFMMGGVVAEINGKTSVPGLYAIGEVSSTGVHGANRLASNSLLECLVMAFSLAEHLKSVTSIEDDHRFDQPEFPASLIPDSQEVLDVVKAAMWETGGIVRDEDSLQRGLKVLMKLQQRHPRSSVICTARLILESALFRRESRGAHFRRDFPKPNPQLSQVNTVVSLETEHCLLLNFRRPKQGDRP